METDIVIAIANDNAITRDGLARLLRRHGFIIGALADNGEELIDRLTEAHRLPDVCIIDIKMPRLNGYETATALKERWPEIKVLAYSMNDRPSDIRRILDCGADSYLEKGGRLQCLTEGLLSMINSGKPPPNGY